MRQPRSAPQRISSAARLRPEALHLVPHQRVQLQRRARGAPGPTTRPPVHAPKPCLAAVGSRRGRLPGRRVPVGRVALLTLAPRLAAAAPRRATTIRVQTTLTRKAP